jgi:hypothetical protein
MSLDLGAGRLVHLTDGIVVGLESSDGSMLNPVGDRLILN